MSILYRIYANDGAGGPVDFTVPIATASNLSYSTPPLAHSSDSTFIVRAFDSDTGTEEANTDSRVRILLDANGEDVSGRPNAPHALFIRLTSAGCCRATWAYNRNGQGGAPIGFYVYLSRGVIPDYSGAQTTVLFLPGVSAYSCTLSGLMDGSTYTVAVRAYNSIGIESNTTALARAVGDSKPPSNVDDLQIEPVYGVA